MSQVHKSKKWYHKYRKEGSRTMNYRLRVIGANVTAIRMLRNISQTELAESTGLTQGYLSKLERGKLASFSVLTLFALSDSLGVDPSTLLRDNYEKINKEGQ